MNLVVLTPDKEVFQGPITSIKVPGVSGQFEILKGHAPVVSALKEGAVRISKSDGSDYSFSIEKGFIEVLKDEIALLVQGVKES